MSVAAVQKPASQPDPKPEATSSKKAEFPRWAKISLVALAVIAAIAVAYYFYQPQIAEEAAKKFFKPTGSEAQNLPPTIKPLQSSPDLPPLNPGNLTQTEPAEPSPINPPVENNPPVTSPVLPEAREPQNISSVAEDKQAVNLPPVPQEQNVNPTMGSSSKVLDKMRGELEFKEELNCDENLRPAQEECKGGVGRGKGLKTLQGQRAYTSLQQRLEKECPDGNPSCPSEAFIWPFMAWRDTPYEQTPERVRALAEEHYILQKRADGKNEEGPNTREIWKKLSNCRDEKCLKEEHRGFCAKEKCGSEMVAYQRAYYGYGTHIPENKAWLDRVATALCPGSSCTLSDREIYDAVDGKKPLPSSWFPGWGTLGKTALLIWFGSCFFNLKRV